MLVKIPMGWDSKCNSANGNRLMRYFVHYLPELSCLSPYCSVMVTKCIISCLVAWYIHT